MSKLRVNGRVLACPDPLPPDLASRAQDLAAAWAESQARPRVSPDMQAAWRRMLGDWVGDASLPLFVRKMSLGRGRVILHESGRELVPADNSPANWSLQLALEGKCPTGGELRTLFEKDQIPIAMALKRSERNAARYRYTRDDGAELNAMGWKVAHIEDVALGSTRTGIEKVSMTQIKEHFLRFLSPANMFVVPKVWAGLAELREMTNAIQAVDGE